MKLNNLYPTKKEIWFILIISPVLLFAIAMIDVPLGYWFPFTSLLNEWMLQYSFVDLFLMGQSTWLVGIMIGFLIILLYRMWKA